MLLIRFTAVFALVISGWLASDAEWGFSAFFLVLAILAATNAAVVNAAMRRSDW